MRSSLYPTFGLTLVVNHACNLRCSYCYTGAKFQAPMPIEYGNHAIRRALASIPKDGTLQLGFFGGEPLIEATQIKAWMITAREEARIQSKVVRFNLTTNGTLATDDARSALMDPDVELAISCDGNAQTHDKHRVDTNGRGSFAQVEGTLRSLVSASRPFTVVLVVRPDTVSSLPDGLSYLVGLGITQFTLSLDIWTVWSESNLKDLSVTVDAVANLWRGWLPSVSIDWFDTRIAAMAELPTTGSDTRCSFGEGEIAVAPSGRLYPCERLVGEDRPDQPLQLPGLVSEGTDFLQMKAPCTGSSAMNTDGPGCRCANFVCTGSTGQENGLLSTLNTIVHASLRRLITATTTQLVHQG